MGRTPTTLTDPRTSMSVCRSGEPAIVAEGAESHTSGPAPPHAARTRPAMANNNRPLVLTFPFAST